MDHSKRSRHRYVWVLATAAATATAVAASRRGGRSTAPDDVGTAPADGRATGTYRSGLGWTLYDRTSLALDRAVGWHRLPPSVGFLVLVGLRNILRRDNLHETGPADGTGAALRWDASVAAGRTADGSFNDLEEPVMGMAGTPFGRNVPLREAVPDSEPAILDPSPRRVSLELLARRSFIPATSVNLLAAAWIQFMVKDWFSHGEGRPDAAWEIPLADDDPWPQRPFRILKTIPATPGNGRPAAFANRSTHWWDGSSIYGSSREEQRERRTHAGDGKLWIDPQGRLILPDDPAKNPALVPGWWLGLNMMATVFVREHNAVCDRLKDEYPHWTDEQLFQRARLVVAAVMAKIHTVEWTTAIIAHPTTIAGLRSEWWGIAGERVRRSFGRIGRGDIVSGIPGSRTDHHGVPYSLTEEFTVVYRMHPLIPDEYVLRSAASDGELCHRSLAELSGRAAQSVTAKVPMTDLFYSFGTAHPGAIVLHNFPLGLIEFRRPDNDILMDIGATDIMRAREVGVPRYNRFRRLLHMKPVRSFAELTGGDRDLAAEISRVYDGDIERVDAMVGMFAEPRPAGFAFSDTAFRIFLLMAARRLNSDRFLKRDFTATVYTPCGLAWVQDNDMRTVLLRHYPDLAPALRGLENAFIPWNRTVAPAAAR